MCNCFCGQVQDGYCQESQESGNSIRYSVVLLDWVCMMLSFCGLHKQGLKICFRLNYLIQGLVSCKSPCCYALQLSVSSTSQASLMMTEVSMLNTLLLYHTAKRFKYLVNKDQICLISCRSCCQPCTYLARCFC